MKRPHIGIVGCSAEGAALCYRTLCLEGEALFGEHAHPEVSMHTHCLADYMVAVEKGGWDEVGQLMLSSAGHLHRVGAEILICPDNTIHQALPGIQTSSPLPWLSIAEVVVQKAVAQGYSQLGILGTQFLMEGPVYPDACRKFGIEYTTPPEETRVEINRIIFEELVKGNIFEKSQAFFYDTIDRLKSEHCDAVVLGCTEIPLIVERERSSLPTLDSTRLLARAALAWAKAR